MRNFTAQNIENEFEKLMKYLITTERNEHEDGVRSKKLASIILKTYLVIRFLFHKMSKYKYHTGNLIFHPYHGLHNIL